MADQAVLGRLFQENEDFLLRTIRRRMSPALARRIQPEDVLQETYMKLQAHWPEVLRTGHSPRHVLYRAAQECLIDAWRLHSRQCRDVERELPWPERAVEDLGSRIAASMTSPSEALRREELAAIVRAALDQLDAIDREIIDLVHFGQLDYAGIGECLGIAVNTAMKRHSRALKRFPIDSLQGLSGT